jgi:hypothetical protein
MKNETESVYFFGIAIFHETNIGNEAEGHEQKPHIKKRKKMSEKMSEKYIFRKKFPWQIHFDFISCNSFH